MLILAQQSTLTHADAYRVRHNTGTANGFSLVEVVTALGIFSVAIIGVISLFIVGIHTGSESSKTTSAANLSALIVNQRRLTPVDHSTNQELQNFALPDVHVSKRNFVPETATVTDPVYVGIDGYSTTKEAAEYVLVYSIQREARVSNVYMLLYWPAQATLQNAAGRFEIATQIPVP
ncbi:MAG: hypothetical protein ACAI35_14940 [Candidatus Methylacidiphilales bacterium]|nr:hypothetical protein [Candidatus Methylacidiphilales bacterium]